MSTDPFLNKRLANFRLQRLLGRGGMASVYYALDVKLRRPVAVKVIDARYQGDVAFAKRFVDEARMIASWRHEHIIHVYYADKVGDLYFFAMEYIDGMSLAELMADYAASGELMPYDDVLVIGRAIASALDYAHNKKVIHRDIKPSNVLIGQDNRVVLADFGLALDVQQGTIGDVFGTPHYISPEQARSSADAVPQSDLYALGVMLYEILTGSVPFDDPSAATLALLHLTAPPPNPRSVNPELNSATEGVLLKALAKNPEDRYQTGEALLNELDNALKTSPSRVSTAELPLPAARQTTSRNVSRISIFDKIAQHLEENTAILKIAAPASEQRPPTSSSTKVSRKQVTGKPTTQWKNGLLIGTAIVIVVVATVIGLVVLNLQGDSVTIPTLIPLTTTAIAGSGLQATETDRLIGSPTSATVVDVPATIAETLLPTDTIQPTATLVPSTNTAIPTFTPIPTETPLPTEIPVPTILYPTGRRVILFYDEYSFYLWNTTGESIRVSPLRFESLNANGDTTYYMFDGSRWAAFFGQVESNRCNALEIGRAPSLLQPAECRGYNAVINPEPNDDTVFWTVRPDSVEFRVLWDNQEIARCEIGISICQIFLP